jgi:YegS/Rv2252/BmrU family lipid kinase
MKYFLIVNPKSGDQSYNKKIKAVISYFHKKKLHLDVKFTQYPGHAAEMAGEYCKKDYDVIIGAGGDGTINEVLNGMIGSDKKLAILPWGTGNVFAGDMNFPRGLKKICNMIRKGRSMKLDAGKCDGRYFLLMCSAGFDAYTLKQLKDRSLKKSMGIFAYFISALKAFLKYRYPEIEVTFPDGRKDRGSFILISNIRRYGTYFTFMPKASPDDGLLDVFVFRETGRWNTLKMALRFLLIAAGWIEPRNRVLFMRKHGIYQAKSLALDSYSGVYTQIDGELSQFLPVEISIVPQAVSIILPPKTIRKFKNKKKRKGIIKRMTAGLNRRRLL